MRLLLLDNFDSFTYNLLDYFRQLGVDVLVRRNDVPLADLLAPGLTAVTQDPATIGRLAVRLLLDRIDGHAGPPVVHRVPTALVARGSGEIPAP